MVYLIITVFSWPLHSYFVKAKVKLFPEWSPLIIKIISAIISYRVHRHEYKLLSKLIHGMLHLCAIGFGGFGLGAMIRRKSAANASHLISFHGWIGASLIILYIVQVSIEGLQFLVEIYRFVRFLVHIRVCSNYLVKCKTKSQHRTGLQVRIWGVSSPLAQKLKRERCLLRRSFYKSRKSDFWKPPYFTKITILILSLNSFLVYNYSDYFLLNLVYCRFYQLWIS